MMCEVTKKLENKKEIVCSPVKNANELSVITSFTFNFALHYGPVWLDFKTSN